MKQITLLIEAIETKYVIECSKCSNKEIGFETYEDYFAEELIELGWRATENTIYCPVCAKKFLKFKNEKK